MSHSLTDTSIPPSITRALCACQSGQSHPAPHDEAICFFLTNALELFQIRQEHKFSDDLQVSLQISAEVQVQVLAAPLETLNQKSLRCCFSRVRLCVIVKTDESSFYSTSTLLVHYGWTPG